MKTAILIFALFGVALASVGQIKAMRPKRCCVPKTFQTNVGGSEAFAVKGTTTYGLVQFAAEYGLKYEEKVAAIRIFSTAPYREVQRLIMDYGNRLLYNITESSCIKSHFEAPLPELCVPESAEYLGDFNLGGEGEAIHCNSWRVKNATLNLDETVAFTDNCYPVGTQATIVAGQVVVFITTGYSNMVPHIRDPTLFHIPESCNNQVAKTAQFQHFMDHPNLPKSMFTRF